LHAALGDIEHLDRFKVKIQLPNGFVPPPRLLFFNAVDCHVTEHGTVRDRDPCDARPLIDDPHVSDSDRH
jgi:hypothetical protein